MDDVEAVYEAIAERIRNFGYSDVTADQVREIDESGPSGQPQGVVVMFANKQLDDARAAGDLPPRT